LGKRSSGWKFLWNWNDSKYYKTKEELFEFIRSGRVVNEYGDQMDQEEFIQSQSVVAGEYDENTNTSSTSTSTSS